MRTFLMSRGRERDYRYLGSAPDPARWREFGQLSAFEYPTLLMHADETGWRVYASAIPTARRDFRNTVIRISLELHGDHEVATAAERDQVLRLVHSWLDGATPGSPTALVSLLDDRLPEADAERLLARTGPDNDDELARLVHGVLDGLEPDRAPHEASPQPGSWVGDVTAGPARNAFLDRVRALLEGGTGWAVQLNLAGSAEIRDLHARLPEPLAALVDERVPEGPADLDPKAATPAPPRRPAKRSRRRALVGAVVAVAALALLAWILAQRSGQPSPPAAPGSPSPSSSAPTVLPGPSISKPAGTAPSPTTPSTSSIWMAWWSAATWPVKACMARFGWRSRKSGRSTRGCAGSSSTCGSESPSWTVKNRSVS